MRCDLLSKRRRANEEIQKAPVELRFVHDEQEVLAADNRAVQQIRHDAEAANLRVNLGDKKLACATYLLRFRFDERTGNFVALDDTFNVKLDARALVVREVINRDELFPMPQHFAQPHGRPRFAHAREVCIMC